jgi:hypothetical protein
MTSLVLELQKDAIDSCSKVSDLLRKAYVVAKKLKVKEFAEWIDLELKGYTEAPELPDYRSVTGQVKAFNPYNGWIPVLLHDHEIAEGLSHNLLKQPVAELENLVESAKSQDMPFLTMEFPKKVEQALMKNFDVDFIPALILDVSQVYGAVEAVRNTVLNWALQLEEDGILGEGMTFSDNEKHTAANSTYHITNNIGTMANSQLQQHTVDSAQSMSNSGIDFEEIRKLIDLIEQKSEDLEMDKDTKVEFLADLQTIKSQLSSSKPKVNIIKEGLSSLRNILEGTTGSLIASGILAEIIKLIIK